MPIITSANFDACIWKCTILVTSRYTISEERKSEVRRRSDTVVVLIINDADYHSPSVTSMTLQATPGKLKFLGSGGSMVAKLKLKGIDGRAPTGVEPAA